MDMSAEELNDRGNEHLERGRWDEAETTFRKAIAAEPQWSPPWYNLGLLYKRQREWQKSLDANL
jgi:tetratricopeptide (TPR) repeat protein